MFLPVSILDAPATAAIFTTDSLNREWIAKHAEGSVNQCTCDNLKLVLTVMEKSEEHGMNCALI